MLISFHKITFSIYAPPPSVRPSVHSPPIQSGIPALQPYIYPTQPYSGYIWSHYIPQPSNPPPKHAPPPMANPQNSMLMNPMHQYIGGAMKMEEQPNTGRQDTRVQASQQLLPPLVINDINEVLAPKANPGQTLQTPRMPPSMDEDCKGGMMAQPQSPSNQGVQQQKYGLTPSFASDNYQQPAYACYATPESMRFRPVSIWKVFIVNRKEPFVWFVFAKPMPSNFRLGPRLLSKRLQMHAISKSKGTLTSTSQSSLRTWLSAARPRSLTVLSGLLTPGLPWRSLRSMPWASSPQ